MISFVITTRNNQEDIGKLIDNISPVADEIIVADTGSTDNTIEIAKDRKAKVFKTEFRNDYAELKNFAISKANSDWIFVLDSDETLSQESLHAIPSLITSRDFEGYWLRRRNYYTPTKYFRHGVLYPDYQLRLFRNHKGYRYSEAVHEKLNIPQKMTKEVPYEILHSHQNSKYRSLATYALLQSYIHTQSLELSKRSVSGWHYIFQGMLKSSEIFFGGLIRGKGLLDGIPGIRAHAMIAASILQAYFTAGIGRLKYS
jgi:glycosyltransferase involved in cell wall biosynthesis